MSCERLITIWQSAPNPWEYYKGLRSGKPVHVKCGKCPSCLKSKQDNLTVRVYRECVKTKVATFVTLDYDPQHIPVAQSFWCNQLDLDSGDTVLSCIDSPRLVTDVDNLNSLRNYFVLFHRECKGVPYLEVPFNQPFENDKEYFVRYTPTLNYLDVHNWLKRIRKNLAKDKDFPKEFKYVIQGEYGSDPNGSHRPHYHCIFFGVDRINAEKMLKYWYCGSHPDAQQIKWNVKSGENPNAGYLRVARYVAKYSQKGDSDIWTVKTKSTIKSRLCSSIGVGTIPSQAEIDWYTAQDVHKYDIYCADTMLCEDDKKEVVDTIIRRLKFEYHINENSKIIFTLPKSLLDRIFGRYKPLKSGKDAGYRGDLQKKAIPIKENQFVYSSIYYLVKDELRARFLQADAELLQRAKTISKRDSKDFRSVFTQIESYRQYDIETTNALIKAHLQQFFSNSKF